MIKEWLWNEWKNCNSFKYYHYFDLWYNNLTEIQLQFFAAYSNGRKTI